METLNRWAFLAINADAGAHGPVVWAAIVAAKYLVLLVPLHLLLIWCAGDRHMRRVAMGAGLGLAAALTVNQAIGLAYYSPRPFVAGLGHVLIAHRASSSMPSNHATIVFAYASALVVSGRHALGSVFAAIGCLVAWSRIYLGVHYPLDMVAAALVSVACASVSVCFLSRRGDRLLDAAEALSGAFGRRIGRALPRHA